jgi:hypothetical protein
MSISAGLEWVGNLGPGAEGAAAGVDRLTASLRALQSVQGGSGGAGGAMGGGAIGALGAAANRAAVIQERSAADLAKIGAKDAADRAKISAKLQADGMLAGFRGEQDRAKAQNAVYQNQAKTADAAYLLAVQGGQAKVRASEKAALVEQQGALKAAQIRDKAAADQGRIQAKLAADIAKDDAKTRGKLSADLARNAQRASLRGGRTGQVSEATTSGAGGAAKAILEGKGIKGALGAFGGKGASIAAVGQAIADIAQAIVSAGAKLADLSLTFGKSVVAAQAYREDVSEAFTTVAGSASAGQAVMQRALATADKLGVARAQSVGQFLDLTTKGFKVAEVERIVGSLYDLTTIDPRASIEGLTKVIGKVQATGRLNQETLNELSTFGLEQSDVIKEVGKLLKKSDSEVLKALSTAGGIRGLGVEPSLAAINKQVGGGPAGSKATEKANRNLSSLIRRTEEIPSNILFDLEVGPGLDTVKGILRSVLDFFAAGSETAASASKAIGGVFTALVEGFTGVKGDDSKAITNTLKEFVLLVEFATPAIKGFAFAVRQVVDFVLFAVAGFGIAIQGFHDFKDSVSSTIDGLGDTVSGAMSAVGSFFVDGLVGGISSGAQRVIDAVKAVVGGAVDTAVSVLKIGSPSKVAIQLGGWFSEGMGIGVEREGWGVANAARVMAEDAAIAASLPMPAFGGGSMGVGGRGAGAGTIIQLPLGPLVVINVEAGADVDEERIALLVDQRLTAFFRRVTAEGGIN